MYFPLANLDDLKTHIACDMGHPEHPHSSHTRDRWVIQDVSNFFHLSVLCFIFNYSLMIPTSSQSEKCTIFFLLRLFSSLVIRVSSVGQVHFFVQNKYKYPWRPVYQTCIVFYLWKPLSTVIIILIPTEDVFVRFPT